MADSSCNTLYFRLHDLSFIVSEFRNTSRDSDWTPAEHLPYKRFQV